MRANSNIIMYQFTQLQQVEPLYDKVEYFSVISTSPDAKHQLQRVADQFFLYRNDHFDQVGEVLEFTSRADCHHFAVEANTENDILLLNSGNRDIIDLDLSEHTLSQNNYATRYMKFIKVVPAKSSSDYEVRYTCKVKIDSTAKYHKDLSYLVSRVFSDSRIQVLLDIELPFALHRISPSLKQVEISPNSNFGPLKYNEIDPVNAMEFYEYFCMLHMNGFPDRSNEHVKLTSMYEGPEGYIGEAKLSNPVYLTVASDINPSALSVLVDNGDCVSLFAKTKYQNVLVTKSQKSYMWRITHSPKNIKFH